MSDNEQNSGVALSSELVNAMNALCGPCSAVLLGVQNAVGYVAEENLANDEAASISPSI
ncbi:MAG: hypothetical protein K0U29_04145 [Gammaproteobacteria bacterium]|nr:hypothetical protein [Gammaproteobacteria bacterium]MCH9744106.1 hypothetical protein [Gammaproteobacteria bacterium]